eukprot:scaffold1053_cov332-Pavlova_lutheri.AAC.13
MAGTLLQSGRRPTGRIGRNPTLQVRAAGTKVRTQASGCKRCCFFVPVGCPRAASGERLRHTGVCVRRCICQLAVWVFERVADDRVCSVLEVHWIQRQRVPLQDRQLQGRPEAPCQVGAPPYCTSVEVEELRLLSKAEEAGLLSAAEKAGLSLSSIEKMGLLSKAEDFGILTLATDTNAPALLTTIAVVCYAAAPALVYFGPDDLFVAEAIGAATLAIGGTAAFGGATLLGTLQKS